MTLPIETRQLRYFLAVADELHVGRAATRLHISQPPLTRQIRRLEDRLGATLFDRSGRRMTLTEAGTAFRQEAEYVLERLGRAAEHARQIDRGKRGIVRIGFVSTLLYGVLPSLVRDFQAAYPRVALELLELTADAQLDALRTGQVDIGFVLCPAPVAGLEMVTLSEEPLIVCLPEQHGLARVGSRIAVEDLSDERFVMFPRRLSAGLYDRIVALAERAGDTLRVSQQAVQMQTIIGLVSAGVGIAIVPACMRRLARPGVVYMELSDDTPAVDTALVRAASSRNRAVVDAFVEFATTRNGRNTASSSYHRSG